MCLNLINTLYSDIIVISSRMCDNVVILALNLKDLEKVFLLGTSMSDPVFSGFSQPGKIWPYGVSEAVNFNTTGSVSVFNIIFLTVIVRFCWAISVEMLALVWFQP